MSQTTKRALAASLKKLLATTTLDKITVKDIVCDCEVNRQTFYYHFQDIYALIEWIYTTEAEKAIDGNKTYDTWQQGFNQVFVYMHDNKHLVMNTYRSLSREYLERFLYEVTYSLLINVVEEQSKGMDVSVENKQFIAHFYKFAFVGIVLDWISTGMKEDPQKIIDQIYTLICGDFKKALEKYKR
ncbi:putative dihydroxyacetone kinase regulator [Mobilisporobacter senegalensis]|uniref:Putative dihydroxyacetone kinase regulator n=1 Tax=Mobilisporobacter senegalensis TaxID=1329262 RepID=A0A3N1XYH1_9FIRM|nr:TetR-like C-terminal domain-containing protein [Mobilisporobacter senegalensis]ROR31653.1 putative dihydroxyacetone kinase regulator [Mobilisporobacter senegalensis]